MYFGADYYPEHWPEERWATDASMMREAKLNIVRLAEFSWAKLEPEEGHFDFEWLDRAIETLAKEGIRVIIGTPTATPPKWLHNRYQDIYRMNEQGREIGFGIRGQACLNNDTFREYTRRVVRRLADHYGNNPNVVAWQIDNEFGGRCFCDSCRRKFINWLKDKYKTIDELNRQWGTFFWSQTYGNWDEVIIPKAYAGVESLFNHNPGLLLDYFRFSSDSIIEYQKLQIDIIRQKSNAPITHNFMGHYSNIDYFNLGKDLDFIAWDFYPGTPWGKSTCSENAMAHDIMRGIKDQNFWVMEQQSGPCGWRTLGDTPEPGQLRLWTYQSIAHGAEAIIYFRWRACTVGREQYWYGILDHDGIGRRRYKEIQQIGMELEKLSNWIVGAELKADVAIVKSYDNVWSHEITPHNSGFDYNKLLKDYYKALSNIHINMDVTGIDKDFNKYKLVIMPAFDLMTEEIGEKCKEYVKNGGALLITFRSGTRTWNSRMTTLTSPGEFREMAGVELEEFDSLNFGRTVKVDGEFGEGTASIWCDVLKSNGARELASYSSHYYKGAPAVTVNSYGKGRIYYVGCDLDPAAMERLMELTVRTEGIQPVLKDKFPGIEAVKKEKDGTVFYIILNHNNESTQVPVQGEFIDLLTENTIRDQVTITPYGVAVLREMT